MSRNFSCLLVLLCCTAVNVGFLTWCDGGAAAEYRVGNGIIGVLDSQVIRPDDSLIELAPKFDLGYDELVAANPGVDPIVPDPGTKVTIPTRWLLPDLPHRQGIVVNLAEKRLYYFPPQQPERVWTYPIGIGDEGWETPTGVYRIIEKIANPAWHVPQSIRKQKPQLPAVVPPGPDNPLGSHALRLSIGTVLIHGTNRPYGIGRKVSHGCMHLYESDISQLFREVRTGTEVTIIRQPVKVALVDDRVVIEVHGNPGDNLIDTTYQLIVGKSLLDKVDQNKLADAVHGMTGLPTDVSP